MDMRAVNRQLSCLHKKLQLARETMAMGNHYMHCIPGIIFMQFVPSYFETFQLISTH